MKLALFLIMLLVVSTLLPAAVASVVMDGSHDAFVAGLISSAISFGVMLFIGSLQKDS
jgi:hypothetical protein